LRATCTHGCAGRRGHAKDCPGSRARASPADRYGGKSLTAVVPAARQPSSRAVGWRVASDFLPPPPRVCPVHPLARCRASEAESSAESGRPGTAEAGHACWGEPRRDCVSCSHSRLEVPRQDQRRLVCVALQVNAALSGVRARCVATQSACACTPNSNPARYTCQGNILPVLCLSDMHARPPWQTQNLGEHLNEWLSSMGAMGRRIESPPGLLFDGTVVQIPSR